MTERYQLKGLFARGGMAEVYLGVALGAEGFEKPVAVKRVLPHLAEDPRIAKMFTAEAKLASFLNHQNIVQTLDVGQGPDGLYIVMELVSGWDLGVLIESATRQQRTFSGPLTAYVATQVVAGLSHAYKKSFQGKRLIVAHRDISPSNILISTEGEVKVADFGIARVEALGGGGTEPGTFKGKVAYAAPEMLRGEPATALSDQFCLGIVLHEMLTGQHPFGNADDLMAYIGTMQKDTVFALPGVAPELADIVRKMLARKPEGRFESIDALAKALAQYLSRAEAPASAVDLTELVQSFQPPEPLAARTDEGGALTGKHSDTSIRASFSLHGSAPTPNQLSSLIHDAIDPHWKPTGAQMDASGRIIRGPSAPARPSPVAAAAPVNRGPPVVEDLSLELDETRSWSGTVVNEELPAPPTDAPLADISIVHAAHRTPGPSLLGRAVTLLLVAGLGAGGYWAWPAIAGKKLEDMPRALAAKLPAKRTAVLQITSEPDGATIRINGNEVGVTPLLTENLYPKANLEVTVSLHGYKPWTGQFRGGEDAAVQAQLQRK